MVGLATYGYKIMRVLGVKAVKVTNARGFCLELSTAITVVIASRYGVQPLLLGGSLTSVCEGRACSDVWTWAAGSCVMPPCCCHA